MRVTWNWEELEPRQEYCKDCWNYHYEWDECHDLDF